MQRPGGGIGGHVGSRCVHRFFDGFGLKWPEMDTARRCHIKPSSSAKADDPVFQSGCDRTGKSRRTGYPAFAGYDSQCPACFPSLLAPNVGREIGGGRATRQPGQVRKEAALTRSGSGRSSVSYLFFERIAQDGLSPPALEFAVLSRKPASRDNQSCGSIDARRWRALNAPQRSPEL